MYIRVVNAEHGHNTFVYNLYSCIFYFWSTYTCTCIRHFEWKKKEEIINESRVFSSFRFLIHLPLGQLMCISAKFVENEIEDICLVRCCETKNVNFFFFSRNFLILFFFCLLLSNLIELHSHLLYFFFWSANSRINMEWEYSDSVSLTTSFYEIFLWWSFVRSVFQTACCAMCSSFTSKAFFPLALVNFVYSVCFNPSWNCSVWFILFFI